MLPLDLLLFLTFGPFLSAWSSPSASMFHLYPPLSPELTPGPSLPDARGIFHSVPGPPDHLVKSEFRGRPKWIPPKRIAWFFPPLRCGSSPFFYFSIRSSLPVVAHFEFLISPMFFDDFPPTKIPHKSESLAVVGLAALSEFLLSFFCCCPSHLGPLHVLADQPPPQAKRLFVYIQ